MTTLLIIIWLLIGAIGVWRDYHGTLKEWYLNFNESYWDFHRRQGHSAINALLWMSPLLIVGGPLTLFIIESSTRTTWYFTTKNKQKQL